MKVAYFVQDLTDPAVGRRLRMLKAGGAEPVVLGFRRAERAPAEIEDCPTVDLGCIDDGRLGRRARQTALAALGTIRLRKVLAGTEVIMARTLGMLATAEAARWACGLRAKLVYECLGVRRVMLEDSLKGSALRLLERVLMRRSSLVVVSSPAFLEAYFRPFQGLGDDLPVPVLLVENKVLQAEDRGESRRLSPALGPPWRIGWMGAIRCQKSFDLLAGLATRRPDLIDVRIHGRPAYSELEDFDARVAALPNLSFGGPYAAADLPRLYGEVHFCWAVDFSKEELSSAWLLPNCVYEGGRFGAVPMALAAGQTGRFLADRGFGVRFKRVTDLESFLEHMTPARYAAFRGQMEALPEATFTARAADCQFLVKCLKTPFAIAELRTQVAKAGLANVAA